MLGIKVAEVSRLGEGIDPEHVRVVKGTVRYRAGGVAFVLRRYLGEAGREARDAIEREDEASEGLERLRKVRADHAELELAIKRGEFAAIAEAREVLDAIADMARRAGELGQQSHGPTFAKVVDEAARGVYYAAFPDSAEAITAEYADAEPARDDEG